MFQLSLLYYVGIAIVGFLPNGSSFTTTATTTTLDSVLQQQSSSSIRSIATEIASTKRTTTLNNRPGRVWSRGAGAGKSAFDSCPTRLHGSFPPLMNDLPQQHDDLDGNDEPVRRRIQPLPIERKQQERKHHSCSSFQRVMLSFLLPAMVLVATTMTTLPQTDAAVAYYDKAYPLELVGPDNFQDGRERAIERIREKEANRVSRLELGPTYKPISSVLWGSVLWLWLGSRSNPLVTPLANLLYNSEDEAWLQDRNDDLFSELPVPLYVLLALLFGLAGFAMDTLLVTITEGDRNVVLQLAGVSLIAGGALELGRLASGEKKLTRNEADRSEQLAREFDEFAQERLQVLDRGVAATKANVHRSEVVQAFRRYYAKYRVADNPEYPLGDLEIEQLLRSWSQQPERRNIIERSQAGFYSGLQINKDADVFVQR